MGVLHRSDVGERHKSSHFFKPALQRLLHEWCYLRPEMNEQPLSLPVPQTAQTDGGAQKIHHESVQQHTPACASGDVPYVVEDSLANGEMTATLARVNASQKGLEERLLNDAPQGFQRPPARTDRALPQLLRQKRNVQVSINPVQTLYVFRCCGMICVRIGNQITRRDFPFKIIVQQLRQLDSGVLVTEKGFQAVRQGDGS